MRFQSRPAPRAAAARKGEHEIALGQILGAGLFNLLAVAGLAGLIEPMDLPVQGSQLLRSWLLRQLAFRI